MQLICCYDALTITKKKKKTLKPTSPQESLSCAFLTQVVMCDDQDMFSMMVIPRDLKLFTSPTLDLLMWTVRHSPQSQTLAHSL